ncbi:hypothetical protein [Trichocoleus sp. FACHB-591]|uniref:hypothetical protein n=1 Tax=Trichocoleus sp. FACHB-591 TaxID=2692872 RepID=UPI001A7EDA5E|nr:hypothetical protein [Trichocoleus sp. FACHB-591]
MQDCLKEEEEQWLKKNSNSGTGHINFEIDTRTNSEPFYDAAWNLCTKGILRPGVTYPQQQFAYVGIIGAGFNLTPYGRQWLSQISGYECTPTEYGRFSQLLAGYSERFGSGYHARSQEAVSCYRAHAYLACCTMCGAASESILLALAIAKTADENRVLRDYGGTSGRSKIENLLRNGQNSYVNRELPNYIGLLKYWRDDAAHGASTTINESEAFTSLLLLLRFAQFADERWNEITHTSQSSETT